jgi:hypothetical protein
MSTAQTFTVSKDMLVTGKIEVEMRKPYYGDLRKARKNYPWDRAENGGRVGYQVDDLLLASLIVSINKQPVDGYRDIIDRLQDIPLADRQALSSLMVELFFLNKEAQNDAYDKAKACRKQPAEYYEVKAEDSPSKTFSCRFFEPTGNVQMKVEQRYTSINKVGAGLEEYMFAYCLNNLNGDELMAGKGDTLGLLDSVEIADVQYGVTFFYGLSSLDDEGRADIKKSAQSIMQQLQKPPAATPPSIPTPTVALS